MRGECRKSYPYTLLASANPKQDVGVTLFTDAEVRGAIFVTRLCHGIPSGTAALGVPHLRWWRELFQSRNTTTDSLLASWIWCPGIATVDSPCWRAHAIV